MDIAVRRVNSVDTNYGMALKYRRLHNTVVTVCKLALPIDIRYND